LKPAQILALVDNHRAAIAVPALSLDACPISKNRLFAQASIFFVRSVRRSLTYSLDHIFHLRQGVVAHNHRHACCVADWRGRVMDSLTIVSERSGQENIFRPIGP
jgi:hypothetical protein